MKGLRETHPCLQEKRRKAREAKADRAGGDDSSCKGQILLLQRWKGRKERTVVRPLVFGSELCSDRGISGREKRERRGNEKTYSRRRLGQDPAREGTLRAHVALDGLNLRVHADRADRDEERSGKRRERCERSERVDG